MQDDVRVGPGSTLLGRYTLDRRLGVGGFAAVWSARDAACRDELVALKILHPRHRRSATTMARFEREARILAALDHPHIAAARGFHVDPSCALIVMEYVHGRSLRALLDARALRGEPLEQAELMASWAPIAEALAHAHEAGIVHRDVKPANVIIPEAAPNHPKLVDFGIAKDLACEPPEATTCGQWVGSMVYLTPEQIRSEPVDVRTDVFALGCVLFELATLRRAWVVGDDGLPLYANGGPLVLQGLNDPGSVLRRILSGPRPQVSPYRPELPAALDDVLATACAVVPQRRYPSVLLLLQAVQEALRGRRRRRTLTLAARPGPQLRAWAEAEAALEVRPTEAGDVATPSASHGAHVADREDLRSTRPPTPSTVTRARAAERRSSSPHGAAVDDDRGVTVARVAGPSSAPAPDGPGRSRMEDDDVVDRGERAREPTPTLALSAPSVVPSALVTAPSASSTAAAIAPTAAAIAPPIVAPIAPRGPPTALRRRRLSLRMLLTSWPAPALVAAGGPADLGSSAALEPAGSARRARPLRGAAPHAHVSREGEGDRHKSPEREVLARHLAVTPLLGAPDAVVLPRRVPASVWVALAAGVAALVSGLWLLTIAALSMLAPLLALLAVALIAGAAQELRATARLREVVIEVLSEPSPGILWRRARSHARGYVLEGVLDSPERPALSLTLLERAYRGTRGVRTRLSWTLPPRSELRRLAPATLVIADLVARKAPQLPPASAGLMCAAERTLAQHGVRSAALGPSRLSLSFDWLDGDAHTLLAVAQAAVRIFRAT
jgi:serine/threonine protein kinase